MLCSFGWFLEVKFVNPKYGNKIYIDKLEIQYRFRSFYLKVMLFISNILFELTVYKSFLIKFLNLYKIINLCRMNQPNAQYLFWYPSIYMYVVA